MKDSSKNGLAAMVDKKPRHLIICFTPRSGSSWLTDLLGSVKVFGKAGEFLNPNFIPAIRKRYPADSLDVYLTKVLSGTRSVTGVASLEVTWFQLARYANSLQINPHAQELPSPLDRSSHYVWLRRRDLTAQGVSLFKKAETGLAHSTQGMHAAGADACVYSAERVRYWIEHIAKQEHGFERWFARHQIRPLRLFYEDIIVSPDAVVGLLADFVDIPRPETAVDRVGLRHKIGTKQNDDFRDKFNQENSAYVMELQKKRGQIGMREVAWVAMGLPGDCR